MNSQEVVTHLLEIEDYIQQLLYRNPQSLFYEKNLVISGENSNDVLRFRSTLLEINTKLDAILGRTDREITDQQLLDRLEVVKNQTKALSEGSYAAEKVVTKTTGEMVIVEKVEIDTSELQDLNNKLKDVSDKVQQVHKEVVGDSDSSSGDSDNGGNDGSDNTGNDNSGDTQDDGFFTGKQVNEDDAVIAWLRSPGVIRSYPNIRYVKSFVSDSKADLSVADIGRDTIFLKLSAQGQAGKRFNGAIPLIISQVSRSGENNHHAAQFTGFIHPVIVKYEYFESKEDNQSGITVLLSVRHNNRDNAYASINTCNILLFKPAKNSQSAVVFSSDKIPNFNSEGQDIDVFSHEVGEHIIRIKGINKPGLAFGQVFHSYSTAVRIEILEIENRNDETLIKTRVTVNGKPSDDDFCLTYITDEKAFINSKNDLHVGLYSNQQSGNVVKINKTTSGETLGKVQGCLSFVSNRGALQNDPIKFLDSNYNTYETICYADNTDSRSLRLFNDFDLELGSMQTRQEDLNGAYLKLALGDEK